MIQMGQFFEVLQKILRSSSKLDGELAPRVFIQEIFQIMQTINFLENIPRVNHSLW